MNNDKSKFELASKIVGLILIVIGIYQAFDAISIWLSLGDQPNLYKQMGILKKYLGILKHFDGAMDVVYRHLLVKFLVVSIFPIILGSYLLMPDNVFIRFTYPGKGYQTVPSMSSKLRAPFEEEKYEYKSFSMGGNN